MAKGYWITFYRSITNHSALADYARLAGPAIKAGGGKFLARNLPTRVYEAGLTQRTVLIEFASVEKAIETFESEGYQTAAKLLQNGVERDVRIVEGAE